MTTEQGNGGETDSPVDKELILELNFIPEWARNPPVPGYFDEVRAKPDQRDRGGDRRSGGFRRRNDEGRSGGRPSSSGGGDARRRPGGDRRAAGRQGPPPERLPVRVSFIPDQNRLSVVARRIFTTKRSYPLMDLAHLFLTKPNSCHVKLEVDDSSNIQLYQCSLCRMSALSQPVLIRHITRDHLLDYFDKEETIGDPATGQFACVARCGLSKTLLGPPNHHSYAAKVQEVYSMLYPEMSLEEYKKNIEMMHDPELIEKWKEESRKQTVYHAKSGKGVEGSGLKILAAEAIMFKEVAPLLVNKTRRSTLPVEVARKIEESSLLGSVRDAWDKEGRSFMTLLFALRAAFNHMDLYLFKAGKGYFFVSATRPCPLNPEHAVDSIREVLMYLREHPGCTREDLVKGVKPGVAMDSAEAGKVLLPLSWLIEKGHIIEFFNGALAVPLQGRPQNKIRRPLRRNRRNTRKEE